MNLFEIKSSLYELLENGYNAECVDPETGEFDEAKAKDLLDSYQDEFADKVDGIAQYIEELETRASALREKASALTERARQTEKKADRLKCYLSDALSYKKYESDAVKIGFRKSVSVNIENEALLPSEYVIVSEVRHPDKTAIKAALLGGAVISGATLEEKQNIQIK